MEDKTVIPAETPDITRIFQIIDNLLLEIRMNGNHVRVPPELRPSATVISAKEADDAIMTSFDMVLQQLRPLISRLAELDPDFFSARLAIFLNEWPKRYPDENLIFFWALKFYIETQAEFIRLKFNR